MTQEEYRLKRACYMASDAPLEIKDKAIKALDEKFLESKAVYKALQSQEESKPDDIGDLD